jgi:mannose-1-phosphate guanylyltransferase/mannose-6-phosphate isomerase
VATRPLSECVLTSGNAGIFLWKTTTILDEIARCLPALSHGIEEIAAHLDTDKVKSVTAAVYKHAPSISIDYGVLEKSNRLVVVPADIGWSDLGDWAAIDRLSNRDERGNTFGARVLDIESENCFVYSDGRLIATVGLKDTVVVDAEDALLICAKERAQEVKAVVQRLQQRGAEEVQTPRTVHRPWGTYTVLEEGPGFKVKRVVVNPGAALSLQLHHQRNEHWVVVAGSARVTNGNAKCELHVGQSTYVSRETVHRLENPGLDLLEIIEVQTGSYLGEDDIVRFTAS